VYSPSELNFELPDGKPTWRVRAMFDGQKCGFRAEAGGQVHISHWTIHPEQMSRRRQDEMMGRFLKGSGPTPEQRWAQEFAGFVRVYRRRFREVVAREQTRYEIDGDDLTIFLPTQEGTALELVLREVESLLFLLAQVREGANLLEGTQTLPLPGSDDWERYEPLIAKSVDSMAQRLYPIVGAFHLKYEELRGLLGQPQLTFLPQQSRSRVSAIITRLDIVGTQAIWAYEDALRETAAADMLGSDAEVASDAISGQIQNPLRIAAVELRDIRCFSHLRLDLDTEGQPLDWMLIVGDNARGKSSLLRAIALGLCNEADAAALLKAIPGPMLRKEAREGSIEISLVDGNGATFSIRTEIRVETDARTEILRRSTLPPQGFPWERIFVCAYGPQRTRHAQSSYDRYAALNAVRSLFDYEADLQNPEVILLRQPSEARVRMERKLRQILMLDGEHGGIDYSESGIALWGPWGKLPLGSLSDGYRSTFQWVLDLIGWLIYAGRFERDEDMAGIVLIDELEQHLHPRWQRYIIAQIHQQFPGIQFITSTHTPLVAAGIADIDNAMLIALEEDENGATTAVPIEPRTLRGQRADQVLTSRAFGLTTSRSPGSADDIARYADLAARERAPGEEEEFRELARTLETSLALGETPVEQTVEHAVRKTLDDMLNAPPDKTTELELKKQLRALFGDGESS
jgi:hypothetical protein